MKLRKHARLLYQPFLPLGSNGKLVTNSKEHWKVALQVAEEGTVLLKNDGILRGEWKYDGVVMTDWRALSNIDEELHAGGDVKMPALITDFYADAPESYDLPKAIADGKIDRGAVLAAVRRVLKMMEQLD